MFKFFTAGCVAAASLILCGVAAHAQTVTGVVVRGTSNPFLAGMPPGSGASGDTAPAQSPLQVTGLNIAGGGTLTFSATGIVGFTPTPADGPDGSYLVGHGPENGIGGYNAPANALIGVFLTDEQPDLSAAPGFLDFGSGVLGTDFASLTPGLKQVFFIGDGLTGTATGTTQEFVIPVGATRFFLGTVDGTEWSNNSGQFTVAIAQTGAANASAPEPGSIALALTATLPLLGLISHRRKKLPRAR